MNKFHAITLSIAAGLLGFALVVLPLDASVRPALHLADGSSGTVIDWP